MGDEPGLVEEEGDDDDGDEGGPRCSVCCRCCCWPEEAETYPSIFLSREPLVPPRSYQSTPLLLACRKLLRPQGAKINQLRICRTDDDGGVQGSGLKGMGARTNPVCASREMRVLAPDPADVKRGSGWGGAGKARVGSKGLCGMVVCACVRRMPFTCTGSVALCLVRSSHSSLALGTSTPPLTLLTYTHCAPNSVQVLLHGAQVGGGGRADGRRFCLRGRVRIHTALVCVNRKLCSLALPQACRTDTEEG